MSSISESRLYSFIDGPREFAAYFLEGQKLIQDLALVHPIRGSGFAYFRDVVLSVQPMIAFLKGGEQLGFYIDASDPYFRLKIEAAHSGSMRCTLIPEDFEEFPAAMHGIVRVQKLFPNNRPPYQSVLEAEGLPLREIVNHVLRVSYQTNSAVLVSEASDQSLLLHQLPPLPGKNEYEYSLAALRERRAAIQDGVMSILARGLSRPDEIEIAFRDMGLRLLVSRPVRFRCSCSRERMIHNLLLLGAADRESLFDPGQSALEVVCEYCKTRYSILREDLERAGPLVH